ncbi:LacI family DNA-binding transcriptional regulator [Deinococcus cellulosilyticus]|uniref:LacI family transcriptional regulator n=1 Tax=Deinococcus cellulosilyticus (strain DSM 18568 / NBRC 106333 / KACC 11606 / 5516J-15) TaxID=1223518 RepID=A0A511MVZ3_DEIC1|nr:LacI family DNA-binding transcriptional regulator [Deinococcus cellulosilyticus]GEM44428.1 LacI family transcriptional regulator [Deinococcus cellulosilyticus NBRC 106333 = KACC 11606]
MARATLKQVAAEAGVSHQTVSAVVNNLPGVKASTREHVLAVMERMNYQPNHAARALRSSRSNHIGYVLFGPATAAFSDPYMSIVMSSVIDTIRLHGYEVMPYFLNSDRDPDLRSFRALFDQGRLDGAILMASNFPDRVLEHLHSWDYPMVAMDRYIPDLPFPAVWARHREGFQDAVRHLARQQRKNLAFVGGQPLSPACTHDSAAERFEGYKLGLAQAGLPYREELVIHSDWTFDGGRNAFRELLESGQQMDGVLAANDRMAVGVVREALDAGYHVPDQLAVIGFDDFEFSRYIQPELTTVHFPVEQMAVKATELLLSLMEKKATLKKFAVPVHLVVRRSG